MRSIEDHRRLVDAYLEDLALSPDLGAGLAEAIRYSLHPGGKRIRPVLCLAVAEAAGADVQDALPAAAAIELVHTFSLVHDDLPALDDDAVRRGRPSTHVAFGEAVAVLAGDALLAEAFRLSLAYPTTAVARELVDAVAGMIGGQYLDVARSGGDVAALHRLKTGRLFGAAVACGLWTAGVPRGEQAPWRAMADDVGLLFQIVDDILDGDGYVRERGLDAARRLADETASRARAQLGRIPADTSVVTAIVAGLAARTA